MINERQVGLLIEAGMEALEQKMLHECITPLFSAVGLVAARHCTDEESRQTMQADFLRLAEQLPDDNMGKRLLEGLAEKLSLPLSEQESRSISDRIALTLIEGGKPDDQDKDQ